MSTSKLVTYDAICAAIKGREYRWEFRDAAFGTPCDFADLNQNAVSGTLLLLPTYPQLHKHIHLVEIYLVRWSDGQYTLERVF